MAVMSDIATTRTAFVKKSGEEGGFANKFKMHTRRRLVHRSKIGEPISAM